MSHFFRRSVHLTVAVAALLIALISSVVRFVVWQRMEDSVEHTMQAAEIRSQLDAAFSLVQDAETGQRGFLLTGQEPFLDPYKRALEELPEHFARLEAMLKGHPEAITDLAECKAATEAVLAELRQTIEMSRGNERAKGLAGVAERRGEALMNSARSSFRLIKEVRAADFVLADTERRKQMKIAVWWTTVAGVCGVVAGLVALFMYRQAQRLASAEELQVRRLVIAEEAGKQKGAFLASMSHEIRTPMNTIPEFTELMKNEPLTEKQRSYLHSIKQSGQSLIQLINDILDLSKAEAGMIELPPQPVDLRETCEFVRTVIGQECAKKGIDLRIDVPLDVPRLLLLDEGRLRQVLVNLAGNAVRFTERGYVRLLVEAEHHAGDRAQSTLTLKVQDAGIGIPAEKQTAIFEAFVQADSRRTEEKRGTGLGLSIVKRLTEIMGGSVSVESEPGSGSTFTVILPCGHTSKQTRHHRGAGLCRPPRYTRGRRRVPAPAVLCGFDPALCRDLCRGQFGEARCRLSSTHHSPLRTTQHHCISCR